MAGLEVEGDAIARHLRAHDRRDGSSASSRIRAPTTSRLHRRLGSDGTLRVVSGAPESSEAGCESPWRFPEPTLADGRPSKRWKSAECRRPRCCLSEREIGISDDHSGVMALGADADARAPPWRQSSARRTWCSTWRSRPIAAIAFRWSASPARSPRSPERGCAFPGGASRRSRRLRAERIRVEIHDADALPALRGTSGARREDRSFTACGCAAGSRRSACAPSTTSST